MSDKQDPERVFYDYVPTGCKAPGKATKQQQS